LMCGVVGESAGRFCRRCGVVGESAGCFCCTFVLLLMPLLRAAASVSAAGSQQLLHIWFKSAGGLLHGHGTSLSTNPGDGGDDGVAASPRVAGPLPPHLRSTASSTRPRWRCWRTWRRRRPTRSAPRRVRWGGAQGPRVLRRGTGRPRRGIARAWVHWVARRWVMLGCSDGEALECAYRARRLGLPRLQDAHGAAWRRRSLHLTPRPWSTQHACTLSPACLV
jgi:hypothetical protein